MDPDKQDISSAQVVLKKTAAQDAHRVMDAFKNAGFEVGALAGNNFSITGPRSHFERHFQGSGRAAVNPEFQEMIETVVFPEGKYEWFR